MEIDRLLANILLQDMPQLVRQRLNIVNRLEGDTRKDLLILRDAIDSEIVERLGQMEDGWTTGVQGDPRYLLVEGKILAVVYRTETHGAGRGGYGIEVGGVTYPAYPRHVDEARAIAEKEVGRR